MVTVVLAAPSGDLHVADITVDAAGGMTPVLGPDHVIEAVRRAQHASLKPPPDELPNGEFGGEMEPEMSVWIMAATSWNLPGYPATIQPPAL